MLISSIFMLEKLGNPNILYKLNCLAVLKWDYGFHQKKICKFFVNNIFLRFRFFRLNKINVSFMMS